MKSHHNLTDSRIDMIWNALHDNRPEDAVEHVGGVLSTAVLPRMPLELRVHALCAACATARALASWPGEVAIAFGWAARVVAEGDPELVAGAAFRHGHALLAAGDPHSARAEASSARNGLRSAGLAASRIYGALCLLQAVSVARGDPSDEQWSELLDEADALAAALSPRAPDPWHTEFSVANVAAHRIHLLASAGRVDEARAVADTTDFSGLSDERRAAVAGDLERNVIPSVAEVAGIAPGYGEETVSRLDSTAAAALAATSDLWRAGGDIEAYRLTMGTTWYNQNGSPESAKAGDWIANDGRAIWTVQSDVFAETYTAVADGHYRKRFPVHAVRLDTDCVIETLEGDARAGAGDWLVMNPAGECWPVQGWIFTERYERVGEGEVDDALSR